MEALVLRTEAIRMINKRIEEGNSSITDGTIGAVASLAVYEVAVTSQTKSSYINHFIGK